MSTDSKLKTCDLRCHDPATWVISECGHLSCLTCAARLRIFCEQKECPVCRLELGQVRAKFAHHSPATFHYSLASLVLWTSRQAKRVSLVPMSHLPSVTRKISRCVHVYQSTGFPIQAPWLTPQVVSEDTSAQRTQQGLVLGILCQSTHLLEGRTVRVKHTPVLLMTLGPRPLRD